MCLNSKLKYRVHLYCMSVQNWDMDCIIIYIVYQQQEEKGIIYCDKIKAEVMILWMLESINNLKIHWPQLRYESLGGASNLL